MPPPSLLSLPGFADPFSSLSHLAGAAVFAVLAVPLVRRGLHTQHTPGRILSLIIFAVSAVLLLSMSGVFHLLDHDGAARRVMQRLDHDAIFVLIAGTFMPIQSILFRGPWRWGMVTFVWTLAAVGVTLKSIYFNSTPEGLGVVLYIGMGWFGVFSMYAIWRRHGLRLILPLVFGGLAYTAGAVLDWADPPALVPGVIRAHEIFHLAVLLGLALHWRFIWTIAGVKAPGPEAHDDFAEAAESLVGSAV